MLLKFVNEHVSIKQFDPVKLPNLTILTGLNGTGKSHLLKAIENGNARIDEIEPSEIVYFSYNDFIIDGRVNGNTNEMNEILNRANSNKSKLFGVYQGKVQRVENKINSSPAPEFAVGKLIREGQKFLKVFGKNKNKLVKIIQEVSVGGGLAYLQQLLSVSPVQKDYLYTFVSNYLKQGGDIAQLIYDSIKDKHDEVYKELILEFSGDKEYFNFLKANIPKGKTLFNLTQEDFENTSLFAYEISEEIKKYKIEYQENKNTKALTNNEFRKRYGKDPLQSINSVLEEYDCNGYFIDQTGFEPSYKVDNFKVIVPIVLKHKTEQYTTSLESISSGEKTLMAIAFMIYKLKKGNIFPRVLLLDEIDSALHPSMARRLLKVITDLFIAKYKMKVIFVSHSPATVALAPDDSIFVVNKTGTKKIEKKSKEEALPILSEGYASMSLLDSDYSISYRIDNSKNKKIVLTEGITDKIILETAWRKLYKKNLPFYIQDCFDASFLKNLLKRGSDTQDGLFTKYEDTTFVALFDFDKEGYANWNDLSAFSGTDNDPYNGLTRKHNAHSAYAMLLPVPRVQELTGQTIRDDGTTLQDNSHLPIELLFFEVKKLRKYFIKEAERNGGFCIKFIGNGSKRKFAEDVSTLKKKDFKNFEKLFEKVTELFTTN
jgi:predicted ATPase